MWLQFVCTGRVTNLRNVLSQKIINTTWTILSPLGGRININVSKLHLFCCLSSFNQNHCLNLRVLLFHTHLPVSGTIWSSFMSIHHFKENFIAVMMSFIILYESACHYVSGKIWYKFHVDTSVERELMDTQCFHDEFYYFIWICQSVSGARFYTRRFYAKAVLAHSTGTSVILLRPILSYQSACKWPKFQVDTSS